MDIILLENLEKVGRKYEIVKVKDGFGRNYLIPQGIGIVANRQNLGKLTGIKRQIAAKDNAMLGVYQGYAAKLAGQNLTFIVKAGNSGRLFGSITAQMVAEKLKALGVELDRRRIIMPDEVKTLGSYTAVIDMHASLDVKVNFEVQSEEQHAEEIRNRPVQQFDEPVQEVAVAAAVAAPVVEEIMESAPALVAEVVEEVVAAPVAIVEEVTEEVVPAPEAIVEEVAEEVVAAPVEEVMEVVAETAPAAEVAAAEDIIETASETAENLETAAEEAAETLESAPLEEEVETAVLEVVTPAADTNYKEEEA